MRSVKRGKRNERKSHQEKRHKGQQGNIYVDSWYNNKIIIIIIIPNN
jgi:ribosomal protein S11